MALFDDLKRLAKLPRSPSPFLSLYLNTRWDSEKQREKVRIFVKTRIRECLSKNGGLDAESRQGLEEDAEKVEHYARGVVNREWDENCRGVAVFACSRYGVYEVVRSYMPFFESFACADQPLLRQAAQHAHAGEPAILALVAGDFGRLVEFELGGERREFSFADDQFPGRHDQGGWSQARYQRHVEDHIQRNLRRVAEHLIKWADERRIRRVVISGPGSLVAAFESHLPKRVQAAICARIHIDPKAYPDVIQTETLAALGEAREVEDRQSVDYLLDKGLGMGRAVTGPESVAEAVASGKVHELYLDADFQEMGWRCSKCRALGIRVPLGCPLCSAPVEGVDLGEEFVRRALAADGKVVTVVEHEGLKGAWGVGAMLRYT